MSACIFSRQSAIPIVMGPDKSTYERVTPPNSFIHVDDFDSPAQLAGYLHVLRNNDDLYNSYFKWKESFELMFTPSWLCRLCELLHTHSGHVGWYPDFHSWWAGDDICVIPNEDNRYGSWEIARHPELYT